MLVIIPFHSFFLSSFLLHLAKNIMFLIVHYLRISLQIAPGNIFHKTFSLLNGQRQLLLSVGFSSQDHDFQCFTLSESYEYVLEVFLNVPLNRENILKFTSTQIHFNDIILKIISQKKKESNSYVMKIYSKVIYVMKYKKIQYQSEIKAILS